MKQTSTLVKRTIPLCIFLLLAALPAWAKPQLTVSISTSKEVVEIINGAPIKKIVPATTAGAGDTLIYTLTYSNTGNEAATNAVVNNPVPDGTSYIDNSATGTAAEISFSIDGGKTFKKASFLTYELKLPNGSVEKHTARPEEYTHLRWLISTVPPGGSGKLGFRVRVK